LNSRAGRIFGLELGLDQTAVSGLIDRKRLGPDPLALLVNPEGTGVDGLAILFLFFVF
jgi:hypothetical protein